VTGVRAKSYLRHSCAGLESTNNGFRRLSSIRLARGLLLTIGTLFCFGLNLSAQTTDAQTTEEANTSWTAVTDLRSNNIARGRVVESHSQIGNRTVDKRSLQIAGSGGQFEFYQDIETETLQVDANSVQITTRTFGRDGNDRKTLIHVTEESKQILPGGGSNIVRITSHSDLNGTLQLERRELVKTRSIGSDMEETNTTVMLPSINGGFDPAIKMHTLRKQSANDTVESETTLLRDGAGNWQLREVRQNTTRREANNLSIEERIFRRDAQGNLVEVSRVVSKASESTSGEKHDVVETYSTQIPGATPDGSLHLVERAATTQHKSAAGVQITKQQLEQLNPGDPNSGLRVSILINDTVRRAPSGLQGSRTIQLREANGSFGVV